MKPRDSLSPGESLLLDTHVVIWMATSPERLPPTLIREIEKVKIRLVSHVSAWEIQIKHEKHGVRFNFSLNQLEQTMKRFACTELPIAYRDIARLNEMQFVHPDPFDRLLMAQASQGSVYLATLDQNIVKTFELARAFNIFTDHPRKNK